MIAGKDKQCERTVVEEESTAKLSSVATPKIHREVEREKSVDKQQAYEDAFLDQMNQYIKYGELESKFKLVFLIWKKKYLTSIIFNY